MKKGQSYISLSDQDDHFLVVALKVKGIEKIELIYAPSFSPCCGWDLVNSNKICIGWNGWLGYTKKAALEMVERIEIKDKKFMYLNDKKMNNIIMTTENKPQHAKTGPKPMDQGERKVPVAFSIKRKHVKQARKEIQLIVDRINRG